MNLEIEWFIFILSQNNIINIDEALEIWYTLGGENVDLETYACEILSIAAENKSDEEVAAITEQFQTYADYAVASAENGTRPGIFVENDNSGEANIGKEEYFVEHNPDAVKIDEINNVELKSVIPQNTFIDLQTLLAPLTQAQGLDDPSLIKILKNTFGELRKLQVNDLHLYAGKPIFVRFNGRIEPVTQEVLSQNLSLRLNTVLLSAQQRSLFDAHLECSGAIAVDSERYRFNVFTERNGVSGSYRIPMAQLPSLSKLGFLDTDMHTIERLLAYHNGIILISGPIGCGKTTTLSSILDMLNRTRYEHIVSLESPIEVVQYSQNCNITQREIGLHTADYHSGLRAALRQDPDIIIIGELDCPDSIENAIIASETGHLVIGTLHTNSVCNTLSRILDIFPADKKQQMRMLLAANLRGIVSQELIDSGNGNEELIYEILVNSLPISNVIIENKLHQIPALMDTSAKSGTKTRDSVIYEKLKQKLITQDVALNYIKNKDFVESIKRERALDEVKKIVDDHRKI